MIADLSPLQTNKRITQMHTHTGSHARNKAGSQRTGGIMGFELTTWILVFLKTLATKTLQHMRSFAENVPKKPH